jgi:hypothetical protein
MSALYSEAAKEVKTASYPEKVMILDGAYSPSVPQPEAEAETETDTQ